MSRYNKYAAEAAAAALEKDARITAQDLFNSFACVHDPEMKAKARRALEKALSQLRSDMSERNPLTLCVDGSYNPKLGSAGIGIMIVPDGSDPSPGSPGNIIFGKPVKAKSALEAEIYALGIGLSYVLDTYPDIDHVCVRYDCVSSTVCAANIDAMAPLGAPYTNFKSALKRAKKRKVSLVFEHVKAHGSDAQNTRCDLLARYYSKAALPAAQLKIVRKWIRKGDGASAP